MTYTVGIPCYNQSEYVADAIQSALDQSVKCEVIVVNDGSTDDSLEIIKRFPVKVIDQVNKGLSSARNTVIMNATTDYILWLDADDILLENCVERLQQEKEDIIAPSFKCFGKDYDRIILQEKPTIQDFKEANRIGYCAGVKRDILLEVGGYSPRMIHGYEDYHLWFDLLKRGKTLKTIPEILWLYRTKEHSMIHDAQAHHEELIAQINKDHKI